MRLDIVCVNVTAFKYRVGQQRFGEPIVTEQCGTKRGQHFKSQLLLLNPVAVPSAMLRAQWWIMVFHGP